MSVLTDANVSRAEVICKEICFLFKNSPSTRADLEQEIGVKTEVQLIVIVMCVYLLSTAEGLFHILQTLTCETAIKQISEQTQNLLYVRG